MENKFFNIVDFNQKDKRKMSHNDGGDNGGYDMEARVAKLESDVENIKTNIADIKLDIRGIKSDVNNEFRYIRGEFKDVRKDMKTDFRILFGAIIAVAIGLAGLMAKGFGWL